MDLHRAIQELYEEKRRLDSIIQNLEGYVGKEAALPVKKRRGRKVMHPDERKEVSERMRKYWQDKRGQSPAG